MLLCFISILVTYHYTFKTWFSLFLKIFVCLFTCMCICICMFGHIHAISHGWLSEDSLPSSVFSFHLVGTKIKLKELCLTVSTFAIEQSQQPQMNFYRDNNIYPKLTRLLVGIIVPFCVKLEILWIHRFF